MTVYRIGWCLRHSTSTRASEQWLKNINDGRERETHYSPLHIDAVWQQELMPETGRLTNSTTLVLFSNTVKLAIGNWCTPRAVSCQFVVLKPATCLVACIGSIPRRMYKCTWILFGSLCEGKKDNHLGMVLTFNYNSIHYLLGWIQESSHSSCLQCLLQCQS